MTIKEASYAALFAALTAVGAQVTIPLPFVPITLQVLVTLLAGAVLGKRVGSLSQIVYVLMGCLGLPVFSARQGGVGVLFGPTGGYLIGFILAAWVVGWVYDKIQHRQGLNGIALLLAGCGAMLAGLLVIYIPGMLVLSWHVGSIKTALTVGVITFLPADLIKGAAAWAIAQGLQARGIRARVGFDPAERAS